MASISCRLRAPVPGATHHDRHDLSNCRGDGLSKLGVLRELFFVDLQGLPINSSLGPRLNFARFGRFLRRCHNYLPVIRISNIIRNVLPNTSMVPALTMQILNRMAPS